MASSERTFVEIVVMTNTNNVSLDTINLRYKSIEKKIKKLSAKEEQLLLIIKQLKIPVEDLMIRVTSILFPYKDDENERLKFENDSNEFKELKTKLKVSENVLDDAEIKLYNVQKELGKFIDMQHELEQRHKQILMSFQR
jgi:predicted RNase H-like nuclease (RuvC/YqgF family)